MIVAGHVGRLKTGEHTRVMGTIGDLYLTVADEIMEAGTVSDGVEEDDGDIGVTPAISREPHSSALLSGLQRDRSGAQPCPAVS